MNQIKIVFLIMLAITLPFSIGAQDTADTSFEGVLTTRISIGGVDMSILTEKTGSQNREELQQQLMALYSEPKLQALLQRQPMMGMVLAMTPPKATIYLKDGVALAKMTGLGYEIEHYHNPKKDEAFIYTASLINPEKAVTATYKPSQGYELLFTEDKRLTPELYNIVKLPQKVNIAGYSCSVATYTPKTRVKAGTPSIEIRKLQVYTSKAISKTINFSHPYYLPEDDGILRIDIFLEDNEQPTMIYEITSVKKEAVDDKLLLAKKTEPLYQLTDMSYGMSVLGIMMGGMGSISDGEEYEEGDEF